MHLTWGRSFHLSKLFHACTVLRFFDHQFWYSLSVAASLELKKHMDGVSGLHVIMCNVLLVGKRLASVNQTNHRHVDALLLLKCLLDLQNSISRLKVERLLNSCQSLHNIQIEMSIHLVSHFTKNKKKTLFQLVACLPWWANAWRYGFPFCKFNYN